MTDMTVEDVMSWITRSATKNDIDLILTGVKNRNSILRNQRQNELQVGDRVETMGLSPKYLNGLTGVLSEKGTRSSVTLDLLSTGRLRTAGRKRFYIPSDVTEYNLGGIPSGCLQKIA